MARTDVRRKIAAVQAATSCSNKSWETPITSNTRSCLSGSAARSTPQSSISLSLMLGCKPCADTTNLHEPRFVHSVAEMSTHPTEPEPGGDLELRGIPTSLAPQS